jgi:tRNA 2-thiouridine synthesizing protein A
MDNPRVGFYFPAMDDARTWDDELDAAGLLCPLPVLKARKRLKAMPAGGVLRLIATDPAAVIDVPHFCTEAGHGLIAKQEIGGQQIYLIRKGG